MSSLSLYGLETLIVDEMDAWFKSYEFKRLGRLLKYIYAKYLTEEVCKHLNKSCHEKNQPDKDPFIFYLYVKTMETLDLNRLETIYQRSRRILKIGDSRNNTHQDFVLHVEECIRNWLVSDFGCLNSDLNVDTCTSNTVKRVLEEIDNITD